MQVEHQLAVTELLGEILDHRRYLELLRLLVAVAEQQLTAVQPLDLVEAAAVREVDLVAPHQTVVLAQLEVLQVDWVAMAAMVQPPQAVPAPEAEAEGDYLQLLVELREAAPAPLSKFLLAMAVVAVVAAL